MSCAHEAIGRYYYSVDFQEVGQIIVASSVEFTIRFPEAGDVNYPMSCLDNTEAFELMDAPAFF